MRSMPATTRALGCRSHQSPAKLLRNRAVGEKLPAAALSYGGRNGEGPLVRVQPSSPKAECPMKPFVLFALLLALAGVANAQESQPFPGTGRRRAHRSGLVGPVHAGRPRAGLGLRGQDRPGLGRHQRRADPYHPPAHRPGNRRQAVLGGPVPRRQAAGRGRPGTAGRRQPGGDLHRLAHRRQPCCRSSPATRGLIFSLDVSPDGSRIAWGASTAPSASGTASRARPSGSSPATRPRLRRELLARTGSAGPPPPGTTTEPSGTSRTARSFRPGASAGGPFRGLEPGRPHDRHGLP